VEKIEKIQRQFHMEMGIRREENSLCKMG